MGNSEVDHVNIGTGRVVYQANTRINDPVMNREAEYEAAVEAVEENYARGETDEFVKPTLVTDRPALRDGDAVVFFNFWADGVRQLHLKRERRWFLIAIPFLFSLTVITENFVNSS